ncbi:AMP-dependent synthetase [Rhodococcus sp. WS3]|uniref:AMP-binding protein n=1 Tax=unclassified Rhodococcus (in: high G+C Gram-positive bacteria) TaxID=192944 RepID=UPI0005D39BC0|nr:MULTISPECIES: AMP-binding protein [unclassified Rhodococcus (in: high G+C Gram-positive bacteria)]KJF19288.1 Long-chain-fatty-acid--CoA ligase [Rhodococcus sp. AD45]ROZ42753.1 AMP-dependent synthetase [Rhodococcus sp. WS3]RZL21021.1 MAG: AMP-dependent synthetase [Rhodococcus sp. (in: high G+C Gram-positive bacteria)]
MNIFSFLDQTAQRFNERGAVFHGIDQLYTWSELRDRALRLASTIRQKHGPGARIAVVSENRPELVELFFGVWAAECVLVPINFKLHEGEVDQIAVDSGACSIFASPRIAERLSPATSAPIQVLGGDQYQVLFDALPAESPVTDPATLAWLFYTSGTTGRSKGAMLTHRNLTTMTLAHLADIDNPDENCSLVHAAPMSHGSGMYIAPYVARGARQVIPESAAFQPHEFLDMCEYHPGATAFLAPTMIHRLTETGRGRPANLRTLIYGGGPMHVETLRSAMTAFGSVFVQIYGQGEAPMTITALRRSDHFDSEVIGSVGHPRTSVEVAVVDESGLPTEFGQVGEIVCRGDIVMAGYWDDPQATSETIRDGWLRTGDMGSFNARGFLTLHDRSKDVVISGGTNIYPREIEEVLIQHPGVQEVSVLGEPDREWGESLVAFVVGDVSEEVLNAHLTQYLARFKRPKRYIFVDNLPKNNYGKILKRELRLQLYGKDGGQE